MKIILLHGWAVDPNNESKWQQFRAALKRLGVESTFLPLPGLSTPLDSAWGLTEYVQWLHGQLKSREKVVLLGHSFGGQLAVRFAATYPDRVAALVLIDSAGIRDRSLIPVIKRTLFAALASVGKKFTKSPTLRKVIYTIAREKDYFEASPVLRKTMAAVLADEVRKDLAHITAPTCIVWGEQDTATPLHLGYTFAAGIANSQLHIITGARHSPHFTHPSVVASYIATFLSVEWKQA